MSDWTQRIAAILRKESFDKQKTEGKSGKEQSNTARGLSFLNVRSEAFNKIEPIVALTQDMSSMMEYNGGRRAVSIQLKKKQEVSKLSNPDSSDHDNVSALKKLRELPRGMGGANVDSRIAAIKNMLGEKEIFKTLQILRWPKGIVCPKCKSNNIVRRDPPPDSPDQRHYYVCLTCKGEGRASDFDDFTGLPVGSLHGLRQWIFCWYLIGFCSLSQISKVLGLSVADVSQIVQLGSQITEIAEGSELKDKMVSKARQAKEKNKSFYSSRREVVNKQENDTRSESQNIYKPGPKSKK